MHDDKSDRLPITLRQDPWGRLVLVDESGATHCGVEAVRAFPFTDPERWIHIVSAEGEELAGIEHLGDLPLAERELVEASLRQREFRPRIERIRKAPPDGERARWDVRTDHGATRISLKGDEDVRGLGEHRYVVTDAQGVRYFIDDSRRLDATSRALLEEYL